MSYMKKLLFSWMMAAAALLVTGVQHVAAEDLDSLYAKDMLHVGMKAPDFMIDSLSNTTLAKMQGRFVVLHFWASWCPDCRKDTPLYNQLYEEFASDSVVFINISFDTDREAWQKYVRESDMGGLQLSELKKMKESATAQAYQVKWIPAYYVLNTEGKVILATVEVEKLQRRLQMLDLSRVRIPRNQMSTLPSYPGGDNALRAFLVKNVNHPRTASNYGLEAQTIMQFTVDIDGSIRDISVKSNRITRNDRAPFQRLSADEQRNVSERCLEMFAEEAERVISIMPKWKPGRRFGIPFKTRFQMPINYKIFVDSDWQAQ